MIPDRPCRYCDRTEAEVASCPSSQATACASLAQRRLIEAICKRGDARKADTNYVADKEVNPTRILFANGRTVRVVRGKLIVGWARAEARKVFGVDTSRTTRET